MADDVESILNDLGAGDSQSSAASDQAGMTPSFDVDAFVDALIKHPKFGASVEEAATRQWQAGKDRRISKMETKLSDFEERMARYEELRAAGKSQADALFQIKVEDALLTRAVGTSDVAVSAPSQGSGKALTANAETIRTTLDVLGLTVQDPEVVEAIRQGGDAQRLIAIAARRKSPQGNAPNPATVLPSGGGQAAKSDLQTQYQTELTKIRPGDLRSLTEIKGKYRKLGLDIY